MSSALNPSAASFVPASRSNSFTAQSAGQRQLRPEAPEFILNNTRIAAAPVLNNTTTINKDPSQATEPGDRLYRRRRNRNNPKLRSPKELTQIRTRNTTPFNQWQAGLANTRRHHASSSQYQSAGSADYQQYETISIYKNGQYGEIKQKSKHRSLADVYGYYGSDKQVHGMLNYPQAPRHLGREQSSGYGRDFRDSSNQLRGCPPGDGQFGSGNTLEQLHGYLGLLNSGCTTQYGSSGGSGMGYTVCQPDSFGQGGSVAPVLFHRVSRKDVHSQNTPSNGRMLQATSIAHRVPQPNLAYNAPTYRPFAHTGTATQAPVQLETQTLAGHALLLPHPSNTRKPKPLRNPAIEQQEGGIAADHDFVTRVLQAQQNASYDAKATIIGKMYREVKDRFFPANEPSLFWPHKTACQVGYVDRVHVLSEMGESQLNRLFEALTGRVRN